jgi:CheY-like chemotaxis protein
MTTRTSFPVIPVMEVPVEEPHGDGTNHRPVVLVVDDERVIADTLSAILSLNGYAPITAYDGVAALELASLIPPEVLITDVMMPRMNGIDLAINIRQVAPDCEVVLFSGQAQTLDLLEPARLAGHAFALLSKPVHPAVLLERVANCLTAGGVTAGRSTDVSAEHHHRTFRGGGFAAAEG